MKKTCWLENAIKFAFILNSNLCFGQIINNVIPKIIDYFDADDLRALVCSGIEAVSDCSSVNASNLSTNSSDGNDVGRCDTDGGHGENDGGDDDDGRWGQLLQGRHDDMIKVYEVRHSLNHKRQRLRDR